MLTGFRALVREVASEHGVRVAKWLGDGAMFVSTERASRWSRRSATSSGGPTTP